MSLHCVLLKIMIWSGLRMGQDKRMFGYWRRPEGGGGGGGGGGGFRGGG